MAWTVLWFSLFFKIDNYMVLIVEWIRGSTVHLSCYTSFLPPCSYFLYPVFSGLWGIVPRTVFVLGRSLWVIIFGRFWMAGYGFLLLVNCTKSCYSQYINVSLLSLLKVIWDISHRKPWKLNVHSIRSFYFSIVVKYNVKLSLVKNNEQTKLAS